MDLTVLLDDFNGLEDFHALVAEPEPTMAELAAAVLTWLDPDFVVLLDDMAAVDAILAAEAEAGINWGAPCAAPEEV